MENTRPIMSGCTETGKPLVSILMAIYEPRMDWLREQLRSLNAQTYPNLRLYIRDDCSPTVPYEEIQSCVQDCISAFPYTIQRNKENLGSNGTFERLTQEAEGEYFAYCDQDDVWLPEKIGTLVCELESRKAALVCSDVIIMDAEGRQTANSITAVRPRHIFRSGEGLSGCLLYRNFVVGCTMLLPASLAKQACPFAKSMVHDHYLALYAAVRGAIYSYPGPLIRYRSHGGNQTGVLVKITTKEDYIRRHLGAFVDRIQELSQRFSFPELTLARQWAEARVENSRGGLHGFWKLWRLRKVNRPTSYFELIGLRLPNFLFGFAVREIQKGKL